MRTLIIIPLYVSGCRNCAEALPGVASKVYRCWRPYSVGRCVLDQQREFSQQRNFSEQGVSVGEVEGASWQLLDKSILERK